MHCLKKGKDKTLKVIVNSLPKKMSEELFEQMPDKKFREAWEMHRASEKTRDVAVLYF